MSYTRILCPVNLSPLSTCLVRHAMAQASGEDARIHVLHAVEPLLLQAATISGSSEALRKEIEDDLQRIVRDAARGPTHAVAVDCTIAEGTPEAAILDAIARDGSDLVVMGLRSMSALSKACFGSTLERVLRETTAPVLALPAALDPAGVDCAPQPTMRVIAAVDFQQPSMEAARLAADYARQCGASLTLLHVMPPAPTWGRWGEAVAQQHATRRERAENELDALARELCPQQPLPAIVIEEGSAWERIAAVGSARPGTLVVMGLGRPGRPFARPGSVAWRVLSAGSHPVLAAPPQPRASRSTRARHQAARETYTETA